MVSVTMSISGPSFALSTRGNGFDSCDEKWPGLTVEQCVVVCGLILHSLKHLAISSLQKKVRSSSMVLWVDEVFTKLVLRDNFDMTLYSW